LTFYFFSYSDAKDDAASRSSTPSKEVVIKDAPRSRGSSVKPTTSGATNNNNNNNNNSNSKETSKTTDDESIKRKRQRLDTSVSNESPEEKLSKPEITIAIPKDLKSRLVDDWHAINTQQKLVELPAKVTVDDIVKQYVQHKKSKSSNKGISCEDISNGILEYFNVMLGSQLLYKVERTQYSDILNQYPDKPMSQIYGSFHLLRLFVKLGPVLSFTTLDKANIRVLIGHLGDFLKFLEMKSDDLFSMTSYSYPQTSEYLRRGTQ
jgi:mortality factor 4-like protein 1